MNASDIGFAVVEAMKKFSPEIIKTEMTRSMEKKLEDIELGKANGDHVIEEAINGLIPILERILGEEKAIGKGIREAVVRTVRAQNLIGPCPICKTGMLTVIRSRRTRKRFVGCTNYSKGCRAAAPLPQKGVIKAANKTCEECGWPIIYVKLGRIPWKLCVNPDCPTKKKVTEVKPKAKKV
jgi:DNA topoisomerase-1